MRNYAAGFDVRSQNPPCAAIDRRATPGLLVLKDGKWVVLRVPYPMGFYPKWLDSRIDEPNAGWKGRGLCARR